MNEQPFDINKLRVASPCSVPWETMTGDERVRRCNSCELNIYNISEMTEREVASLIANREERLCIRLHKRADGTVLTKDCPVGLRAYQKRVARFAGAALTAILGLFSASSFGQKADKKTVDPSRVRIIQTADQNSENVLTGTVYDPGGAVVPNAAVRLYKKEDKDKKDNKKGGYKLVTDENGVYEYSSIPIGIYILEVKAKGFKTHNMIVEIKDGKKNQADLYIESSGGEVTVGIFTDSTTTIDITSSSVQTTITKKMMERQP